MANTGCIRTSAMLGSLLTMLFIVLKLFSVLHWSWVWVTSPLWIVIVVSFLFTFIDILFPKKKNE
jgi:hypothetical protein